MKLSFYFVYLFVFTFITYAYCEEGPKRSPLAIAPFPRVGRANYATWDLGTDIGDVMKRSKMLVQFPRVGRSDYFNGGNNQDVTEKRSGSKNMNTGLWFGPRLGRLQKRDNPFREGSWAYLLFREAPMLRDVKFTPDLLKESDEVYDDMEIPTTSIINRTA